MEEEITFYILDAENNVVPTKDAKIWGRFFEDFDRRTVKREIVGPYLISTVFLGIDHGYFERNLQVFETMVFKNGKTEEYMERYGSWAEAEEGHQRAVALAKAKTCD